jgi:putative transposase
VKSPEAATKLLYLALLNVTKKWKSPPLNWKSAANQFAIQFGPRFCQAASPTTQAP